MISLFLVLVVIPACFYCNNYSESEVTTFWRILSKFIQGTLDILSRKSSHSFSSCTVLAVWNDTATVILTSGSIFSEKVLLNGQLLIFFNKKELRTPHFTTPTLTDGEVDEWWLLHYATSFCHYSPRVSVTLCYTSSTLYYLIAIKFATPNQCFTKLHEHSTLHVKSVIVFATWVTVLFTAGFRQQTTSCDVFHSLGRVRSHVTVLCNDVIPRTFFPSCVINGHCVVNLRNWRMTCIPLFHRYS